MSSGPPTGRVVVGTRGSRLALAQAGLVCQALRARHPGLDVEVRPISTTGDQQLDRPLAALGARGVFVDAIEAALRAGHVDLAVHSAKDLPSTLAPDMALAAFLPRADARDVLVAPAGGLRDLPAGARVGTSSPRRACQLQALRPDLQPVSVRGNVDTRLRKLAQGEVDALLLAAAGLLRLGLADRVTEWLPPDVILPAVGQGALAVEARADNAAVLALLAPLDDPATRAAVTAERAFLATLGAGCAAPIAAHATLGDDRLALQGLIGGPAGQIVRGHLEGAVADAVNVGRSLATTLLAQGGALLVALAAANPVTHD